MKPRPDTYVARPTTLPPPLHASIVKQYESTTEHPDLLEMRNLSEMQKDRSLVDRLLLRIVLWRRGLPYSLMTANPVAELSQRLERPSEREQCRSREIFPH